jgi:hypothetical protein
LNISYPYPYPPPPTQRSGMKTSTIVIIAVVIPVIVIASILVLKYVPLKYEETPYTRSVSLAPEASDTKWFAVPKGYTADGSYQVTSNYPVKITVFYGLSIFGTPQNVITSQTEKSGTFYFEASGYASDDKYYIKLENPESSGFFGWGAGAAITVRYDITVSGWTTWL